MPSLFVNTDLIFKKNKKIPRQLSNQLMIIVGLVFCFIFLFFQSPLARAVDTTPPTTPGNFTATSVLETQINLSWDASTDPDDGVLYYKLLKKIGLGGSYSFFATTSSSTLTYIDSSLSPWTYYAYALSAYDHNGNFSSSTVASAVTPDTHEPTAPSNVTASATSDTSLLLSWSASTDNVGVYQYTISRRYLSGSFSNIATTSSSTLSFLDVGLYANGTYTYIIYASDQAGNSSSSSSSVVVMPDLAAPSIPGSLTASTVSATSIQLSWASSTDDSAYIGYAVYRNNTAVATTTSVNYLDSGLTANTTYNYNIRAYDASGNYSSYSATTTGNTTDSVPPSVPSNVTATATSYSTVTLTWAASTDNVAVAGYIIVRDSIQVSTTTNTFYYDSGLSASTTYSYGVIAYDAAANKSATSSLAAATTPATGGGPSIPATVIAAARSSSTISVAWTAGAGGATPAGYVLYRNGVSVATTTATSTTDTGLSPQTSYAYAVRAFDSLYNYSASSTVNSSSTAVTDSSINVPQEFQDLYPVLQNNLATFAATTTANWDGSKYATAFGGELTPADNKTPAILTNSDYYNNFVYQVVNNYKNMGFKAVKVQVHFPVPYLPYFQDSNCYTPVTGSSTADYNKFITFYQNVKAGLQAAGIKMVLQNQDMPSSTNRGDRASTCYYNDLTSNGANMQAYYDARRDMAVDLANKINPDYLEIESEPTNEVSYTGFSVLNSTTTMVQNLLQPILTNLATSTNRGTILVGVGIGTWQQNPNYQEWVKAFMGMTGIDYFDIHIYGVNNTVDDGTTNTGDLLGKAVGIADLARSINPSVKLGISEAWLYKRRDAEIASKCSSNCPTSDDIYGRDLYSFWSPLDQQFLQEMINLAMWKHMDFYSASYPAFLFTYQDYHNVPGCPQQADLTCTGAQLMSVGTNAGIAIAGTGSPTYSSTGQAYIQMLATAASGTAPLISAVTASSTTASSTVITWSTDLLSDSQVNYGTSTNYTATTTLQSSLVASHSVSIGGLNPSTTYHYRVLSRDGNGNLSVSIDYQFTTQVGSPPASGLIGYWNFDEATGTVVSDSSGNGYSATANNMSWVYGVWGNSGKFNGSNSSTTLLTTDVFDSSATGTISAWVNWSGVSSTSTIFDAEASASNRFSVLIYKGSGGAVDLEVVGISGGVLNLNVYGYIANPTTTPWHNVVYQSSAAGNVLFIDGNQVTGSNLVYGSGASTTPFFFSQGSTGTTHYVIGSRYNTTGQNFSGNIDELRIYNRILSQAEITSLYNYGINKPTVSNFTASPSSVAVGNSSNLSWSSAGAAYLSVSPASYSSVGTSTQSGSVSVLPSVTTTYTIGAANGNGTTTQSVSVVVTNPSDTSPPTTPTNFTATSTSFSQINLSWTASNDNVGVTGYNIYRCLGTGCILTLIGSTSNTSYSDSNLSSSTTYSYALTAYDAAGNNSATTSPVTATTSANNVPPEFQDLYPALQSAISSYQTTLNGLWNGVKTSVSFGTELPPADNYYTIYQYAATSSTTLNSYYNQSVVPYINWLQTIGVTNVKFMIHYPMLYQPYYQNQLGDTNLSAYNNTVAFYQQLVTDLHNRWGMKAIIQSDVQPNGNAAIPGDPLNLTSYYQSLTFDQYVAGRAQNTLNIAQLIRPDYLNFQSEPSTEGWKTGTSNAIYAALEPDSSNPNFASNTQYLQSTILSTLLAASSSLPTLHSQLKLVVGMPAGEYIWQTILNQEVALGNIDVIDIHLHAILNSGGTIMSQVLSIADAAHAAGLAVGMNEVSEYKQRSSELQSGSPVDSIIESRDHWSFWAPIDQQFLQAMIPTTFYENMVYFDFAIPAQLFSYIDYYNTPGCPTGTTTTTPPSYVCTATQWNAAQTNTIIPMLSQTPSLSAMSQTAQVYSSLINSAPGLSNILATTTATSTTITWNSDTPSDSQVNYGLTSNYGSTTTLQSSLVTSHSVSILGLSPGQTYHYRVLSRDGSGNLAVSSDQTLNTGNDSQAPTAPASLTASSTSNSQVALSWSASTDNVGVAGYQVFRNATQVATSTVASYLDTGLRAATGYSYYVRAFDSSYNYSASSTTVNATTSLTTIPWSTAVPTKLGYMRVMQQAGGRVDYSPTGDNKIYFDKVGPDGVHFQIYVMNFDASGVTCITCSASGIPQRHVGNPAVDPTGKYIIFQAQSTSTPDWGVYSTPGQGFNNDIWVMNIDGSNPRQITHLPNGQGVLHPHFSRDGSKVTWGQALSANSTNPGGDFGTWELVVADFNGNNSSPVTNIRTFQPGAYPNLYETHGFTPDGSAVIYAGNQDGQSALGLDIYEYNFTSGTTTNLTNTPNIWDEHAQFSPDGTKILWMSAYQSATRGVPPAQAYKDWWIMDADGSNKQQVSFFTDTSSPEYIPSTSQVVAADTSWSPDGSKFVGTVNLENVPNGNPAIIMVTYAQPAPPTIYNVATGTPSASSENVAWSTDLPSNSQILYGVTAGYGSSTPLDSARVTGHSVIISGLAPSTTYHFAVTSQNGTSTVTQTSDLTFTTATAAGDSQPPTTPTILTATADSPTTVGLTWNASTDNVGVSGYYIYRNGVEVGTINTNSYSDSGLEVNTLYSYQVAAYDAAGNVSNFSNTATTTTPTPPDTQAPTVPTFLSTTAVSQSEIDLNWVVSIDNVGVAGYQIYRNGVLVGTSQIASYADTGLNPSTLYSYQVAAYDAAGNVSELSDSVPDTTLAVPDTQAPTVPTGLTANAVSSSQIDLSWSVSTDNNQVSGYQIYRNNSLVATTNINSYSDLGLGASTTYTYNITAYDPAGNISGQSTSASATTQAAQSAGGFSGGGGGGGGISGWPSSPTSSSTTPAVANNSIIDNSHPNKCLINQNGTFYYLANGQRMGIANEGILKSYGFTFSQAVNAYPDDQKIPIGPLLLPRDGSLVKSANNPTVYLVSNQQLHGFTNYKIFGTAGFKNFPILTIPDTELAKMPIGSSINSDTTAHQRGLNIDDNGTIYWLDGQQRYPYTSLDAYNSWNVPNDFSWVVSANNLDLSLPVGYIVPLRNLCTQ